MLPHLHYGICIWGSHNCKRLKTIQKRTLRNINGSNFNAHAKPICKNLQALLLGDIFDLASLKVAHKVSNHVAPKYFNDFPCLNLQVSDGGNDRKRKVITPSSFDGSSLITPVLRPLVSHAPKSNRILSQKCLRFHIGTLLDLKKIPKEVVEKLQTHSLDGFVEYTKKYIFSTYNVVCTDVHCFSCSQ